MTPTTPLLALTLLFLFTISAYSQAPGPAPITSPTKSPITPSSAPKASPPVSAPKPASAVSSKAPISSPPAPAAVSPTSGPSIAVTPTSGPSTAVTPSSVEAPSGALGLSANGVVVSALGLVSLAVLFM